MVEVFGVTISEGAIANILARAQAPLVVAAQPLEQGEASKSKRPLQTITPLAQELTIAPVPDFGKGQ